MDISLIWRELLGLVQPVVLGLAGWGLNTLRKWIGTKNNNEALDALIGRMNDAVLDAVKTVFQIFVSPIRKNGGVMTLAQQLEAKVKAIAIAKANMGPKLLKQIKKANGYTDAEFDEVLAGKVEKVVHDSKPKEVASAPAVAPVVNEKKPLSVVPPIE